MKYLDIYSVPINFTYKKKFLVPSLCGGCVSFLLLLLLFAYLGYLLADMGLRQFPDISEHTIFEVPPPLIILKDKSYDDPTIENPIINDEFVTNTSYWYTSLGLRYNDGKTANLIDIDDSILNVTMQEVGQPYELVFRDLKYSQCPKFGNGFVSDEQFQALNLNRTFCLNDEYKLAGPLLTLGSYWLEIKIAKCHDNPKCKNATVINSVLPYYQFEFYYQSRTLNITAYEENITSNIIKQTYWDCISSMTKISELKLSMDTIRTNDKLLPRFIVPKFDEHWSITIKDWTMQTKDLDRDQNLLIIRVALSRIKLITERTFPDILMQLASIGGVSGIVFPLGFLVVYFFSWFRTSEKIMNDSYSLIDPDISCKKEQSFDTFLTEHFMRLMNKYYLKNRQMLEKEWDEVKNNENIDRSTEVKIDVPKIEIEFPQKNLEDMENLMDSKSNSAHELFFSLKRIEDIYDFTLEDRKNTLYKFLRHPLGTHRNPLGSYDMTNDDCRNINLIQDKAITNPQKPMILNKKGELAITLDMFFQSFKRNERKFLIYNLLYDTSIYKCNDKVYFSFFEMIGYFFFKLCCNCKRKKVEISGKTVQAPLDESHLMKKYRIFDGSVEKLGIDFDLISILKTVEGFDDFTKVFYDRSQRGLFNSVSKRMIKITPQERELAAVEEQSETDHDYQELLKLNGILFDMIYDTSAGINTLNQRMLGIMGWNHYQINRYNSLIEKEKEEEKLQRRKLRRDQNTNDRVISLNKLNLELEDLCKKLEDCFSNQKKK